MFDKETVIVTGGRGRLGSRTAQALADNDHDVVAVDRTTPRTASTSPRRNPRAE